MFATAGFCACWVDVRGRGDSDGVFDPYRNDGLDGVDVIAWAAAQEWCDGSVATFGGSYSGRIQWLTALHDPPALRAMIVLVTPSDPFVENPTGVPGPMHVHWSRMTDGRAMQYTEAVDWMEVYRHRPLIDLDEAAGFHSELWREQFRHQTLDAWWEPLRYQHRIGEVDVPVMHISGWYDDEEIGTPANFAALRAAGRAGQRLLMGPWGHQVNAGRNARRTRLRPRRRHRHGGDDDELPGRDGPWPSSGRSVAAGADLPDGRQPVARRGWMAAAGKRRAGVVSGQRGACQLALRRRAPSGRLRAGRDHSWTPGYTIPTVPVPFITPASSAQIGGPDDYSGVETRGDVLVYTSTPLTEPLDLVGPVRLVAFVSTRAADTDLTAKLVDLHPNGFAQRLCDGLLRLRYRGGHERAEPGEPDTVYEVEVVMWDTAQRFLAGHCIRLEVASSAHPKFAVNLGTGGDESVVTNGIVAHNRLYHDAARPSRLLLTVLAGGSADASPLADR